MQGSIIVTGGAGFIGSAVVKLLMAQTDTRVIVVDKLTYAGNLASLASVSADPRFSFELVDISDAAGIRRILATYQPAAVLHLAAESHVDRSIDGPAPFVETNIIGTYTLLSESLRYCDECARGDFRFVHVSTDEVFGSLGEGGCFVPASAYDPSSPYAASKAAADHLARAWHRTYGLPVIVTNCTNNYGPFQFPEKLIPNVILRAIAGLTIPVYGEGRNVRDWLYVDDHANALQVVMEEGVPGETYLIGGQCERTNIEIVSEVCAVLDELRPRPSRYESQIRFVPDRPGHDYRYAIDASRMRAELGWQPRESLASALRNTVQWYLDNESWWRAILSGAYRLQRLGHPA